MAENSNHSTTTAKQYRIKRRIGAHQKIRQMLAAGYTHSEIRDNLGLPERTYRRYVSEVFDNETRVMLNDKATAFEVTQAIAVCIDQFTQQYRELREMSQDKSVPFKDRIEAHHLIAQLSIALVKMRAEVPSMYIAKTGFTLSELAKQLDNVRYHHNTGSTNANGGGGSSSGGHHNGILTD